MCTRSICCGNFGDVCWISQSHNNIKNIEVKGTNFFRTTYYYPKLVSQYWHFTIKCTLMPGYGYILFLHIHFYWKFQINTTFPQHSKIIFQSYYEIGIKVNGVAKRLKLFNHHPRSKFRHTLQHLRSVRCVYPPILYPRQPFWCLKKH